LRKVVVVLALAIACGACRGKSGKQLSSNLNAENKVTVRQVALYYESAADMMLHPEPRNVAVPENPAGAMSIVVRELFKGPVTTSLARSFPKDTVVRGAFLLPDGTAFVDLGGATLTQGWGTGSHEELMAVYGVVQTVTANFNEVKRVRLLVNGEPAETLAGHVNLARSLEASPALVAR
jgi:spore germination protein GerM